MVPYAGVLRRKKKVSVSQPKIISAYNKDMGGVDRADQNIANYRISIRSKKWWWPLFIWPIDMVISNAWVLYRQNKKQDQESMSLLAFRREIATILLLKFRYLGKATRSERPRGQFVSASKRVKVDIRFDHVDHYQSKMDTQKRCGVCKKTRAKAA